MEETKTNYRENDTDNAGPFNGPFSVMVRAYHDKGGPQGAAFHDFVVQFATWDQFERYGDDLLSLDQIRNHIYSLTEFDVCISQVYVMEKKPPADHEPDVILTV